MSRATISRILVVFLGIFILFTAISINKYIKSPDFIRIDSSNAGSFSRKVVLTIDDIIKNNDQSYTINGWAILKGSNSMKDQKKIILLNEGNRSKYLFYKPTDVFRRDVTEHFYKKRNYDLSGFQLNIPLKELPPGNYRLGVQITTENGQYYIMSNEKIKI
ncbi:hypothetical protein [Paenibacillus favisporus]|uniref:hypothetical protein n=1 Tax=Paenibacillus favisporus TaxID=221028 RepID=UPI0013D83DD9|nr:hypothetical protein [Paenibacillus favisporus]